MNEKQQGPSPDNCLNQFYNDTDEDDWLESSYADLEDAERFQNSKLIASGGMKNIYEVFDSKTSRDIVLARLRDDVPEEQVEYFLNEAYLTARLEHPNIISVYDIGRDDEDQPFFTMELKVGYSLQQILQKRAKQVEEYLELFPLQNLLEIFIKVCDAVAYAHSQGILHQDIKPGNIQVGKFGEVQLCDWGLGCSIDKINTSGRIEGTPGYMSPEQINPEKSQSFESDIYSLGALLYSILTDKAPGKGGIQTVIHDTVSGKITFPIDRFPKKEIPASLDAVVRKAMSIDSNERYMKVEKLKEEVVKYITGHSTTAENAGLVTETSLFYRRNKIVCNVVCLALSLFIIGTVTFLIKLQESNTKTEVALNKLKETYVDLEVSKENERKSFELYKEQHAKQSELSNKLLRKTYEEAVQKIKNPFFYLKPLANVEEALESLEHYYQATQNNGVLKLVAPQ